MNPLMQHGHLFGPLFVDSEISEVFGTDRFIMHFTAFERALAVALGEVGSVPCDVAAQAIRAIDTFVPDLAEIASGVDSDAMPTPAFVRQLKAHAGPGCVGAVHTGATSQDLIDTAMVLALREANDIFDRRLVGVAGQLRDLSARFGHVQMMGRTRMQAALPVPVAHRIESWLLPLDAARAELLRLRPVLEVLQCGGPVGTRHEADPQGAALAASIAAQLALQNPPASWHTARAPFTRYAGWLCEVTATLGKLGQDMCLMAQQGVDDLKLTGGGTSSAMPHKQNPVDGETLIALARYNAGLAGVMHQAQLHEQERSGAAWTLEWMTLPAMVCTTGRALVTAQRLLTKVERIGPAA